ncbi:MAG: hypothetical protein GX237_04875 [Clostridiales bacterium]|nr:hypothetical protein [Clostridiales bacterium]
MVNIEEIKKELLKVPKTEIQPNTFAKELLEDFRRDFPKKNKTQNFREAYDKFKQDFYDVLTSLKKQK